jgi:hypothetical protein
VSLEGSSRTRRLFTRLREWDDPIGSFLEVLDGVVGIVLFAFLGFGLGFGAAELVGAPWWLMAVPLAVLVPLGLVILVRAAAREDERNRLR